LKLLKEEKLGIIETGNNRNKRNSWKLIAIKG